MLIIIYELLLHVSFKQKRYIPKKHSTYNCTLYLKMSYEGRRSRRDKAPLSQDACLDIIEFQTSVVARHLT